METIEMTQLARNNKLVMISHTAVSIVISLAYILEVVKGSRSIPYVLLVMLLALGPVAADIVLYMNDRNNKAVKYVAGIGYLVLYTFVLFTTTEPLVFSYIIPMAIVLLVYADGAYSLSVNAVAIVENLIAVIIGAQNGTLGYTTMASAEIRVLVLVLMSALGYMTTKTLLQNDNQRITDVMGEKQKTEGILNNIVQISGSMTEGIDRMVNKVQNLTESVTSTKDAMEEVMKGTNDTAQAVQQQLLQTQEIERQTEYVDRALKSIQDNMGHTKKVLQDGQQGVDVLVAQAKSSVEEGSRATKELATLDTYISQMNSIVDIISNITSQTSLLALNASIEAARAGEAGKGFAVVASEISTMASQTDDATQEITTLITNVSAAINDVVTVVHDMINEINQEKVLTEGTRTHFRNISDSTMEIEHHLSELSGNIEGLVKANREISESIQTISAVSEEVSAHSDSTYASQESNIDTLEELNDIAEQLKQLTQNL
jgi:methyl-accepting chemotaxis protein